MSKYAVAPRDWLFNAADRETYGDSFWRCPTRLVTDGPWAELWRESATCRGGGAVSSLLPVLALHTWTDKRYLGPAPTEEKVPGWTTYMHLSYRRIARLAGITPESVVGAFTRLEALHLLQRRRVPPPPRYGGPERQEYRLAETLYTSSEDDRWAKLPGNLFYGALWAMLPTPSARHLYVTLACLDPVLDEASMAAKLQADGLDDQVDPLHAVAVIRARHPLSIRDMATTSGMTGSTVDEALGLLRTPLFWRAGAGDKGKRKPDLAMVDSAEAERPGMRCYFPARAAQTWFWTPDTMNDRKAVQKAREDHWPAIAQERHRRAAERQSRAWRADAERVRLEREQRKSAREAEKARRSAASKAAWERRRAS
jgi:hypothetical protein